MLYKRKVKTIYTKDEGLEWRKKQICKSVASAERAMQLLQGLEDGTIKPSEIEKYRTTSRRRKTRRIRHRRR